MRGSRLVTTQRVVCLAAPGRDSLVDRLDSVVRDHGLSFVAYDVDETIPPHELDSETLGVVVGGDGTFLRAVGLFAPREIPIVGISAGTLSFLTRTPPAALEAVFDEILRGRATLSEHQQLHVSGGGVDAVGINEVTIEPPHNSAKTPRCALEMSIEAEYVGCYEGGGLAVNTPTGSTAMALSAGGPIHDADDNHTLQVTPLHTDDVAVRPLVVDANREITVVPTNTVRASVDGGRPQTTVGAGDRLRLTGGETPVYLVRTSHSSSFMEALTEKLGWRPREEGVPPFDRQVETEAVDVLSTACRVAREATVAAGEPVAQQYDRIDATDTGASAARLDAASQQSERITTAVIEGEFPEHALLVDGRSIRESNGSYTWVVDPLDGTGNFAHGNPNYTIAVALVDGTEPVVGAVHNPETGELFHAVRGRGAYRNDSRIEPTDRDQLDESMLLSGYDPTGKFLERFYREARGIRRLGCASLHLCFVAAGSADGHWEFDTYPWDVAAGLCILREAGGRATDADGNEYRLRLDETDPQTPLLTSNGPLHETLLDHLPEEGF
jgi:myo-inositol-1(or 4)-monophosphatase